MAKKPSKSLTLAKKLGKSKYGGVFAEIAGQQSSNSSAYTTGSTNRINSLNRELGSITASNATTQERIKQLGLDSGNMFQQAIASSQARNTETKNAQAAREAQLMSTMEAERAARGLSGGSADQTRMALDSSNRSALSDALAQQEQASLGRIKLNQEASFAGMQASSDMLTTSNKSKARGLAESDLMGLYNNYLSKKQELDTLKTTKTEEKQDYINQTYLTLKEKAAARAAEKAQAKLQAAIAQGKLDFSREKFQVDTQYKYDKLAADKAKAELTAALKRQGLSQKDAKDKAELILRQEQLKINGRKVNLAEAEFDWKKLNPSQSANQNINDIIAAFK